MKNQLNLNLKNLIVLITGSTRGLGLVLAKKFLSEGSKVAINGINRKRIERTIGTLTKNFPKNVIGISADVAHYGEVKSMVEKISNRWGRIDVLINNAALVLPTDFEHIDEDEWDRVLNTNLKGMFNTCHVVLPVMKKNKRGKIINISSESSRAGGLLYGVHYSASKGGAVGFSKALAKEIGKFNITVNVVTPGFLNTETSMRHLKNRFLSIETMIQRTPLKRLVAIEEVANLILILASPLADAITGQNFPISGGMVL